jgi:DNA-binding CsgD family transcriptional regulator
MREQIKQQARDRAAAMVAAVSNGVTLTELARQLGISAARVSHLIRKHFPNTEIHKGRPKKNDKL